MGCHRGATGQPNDHRAIGVQGAGNELRHSVGARVFGGQSGWDYNFEFVYQFGKFGQGDGEFARPQSLLIDHGLVYVTDACNHRICVFKTDGSFVSNLGRLGSGPGEFRFPYGLDQDSQGHLVICEFGNNRVQRIDKATGQSLGLWGHGGREPGQLAYPWGVIVDKHDRVIVVDSGNNRLQVFGF